MSSGGLDRLELPLTEVAGLGHGQAQTFSFRRGGEEQQGFVIRHGARLFAYHNRCPHWGVDLDMGEGRFFSELANRILCSNHGALFEVATGICEAGPCVGRSLESFDLRVEGELLIVEIAERDPDPR